MITVYCINNKGQRFQKVFDSPYKARIFILRCKHGHNVLVEGFTSDSPNATEELACIY